MIGESDQIGGFLTGPIIEGSSNCPNSMGSHQKDDCFFYKYSSVGDVRLPMVEGNFPVS